MDSNGIWVFYYIQGEDGEDRSHPNAYQIPQNAIQSNEITLNDVQRYFPLPQVKDFHFRFRLNYRRPSTTTANTTNSVSTPTFFWLDITNSTQKVPLINGRVICQLLRLIRPKKNGLTLKRKPVLKWANKETAERFEAQKGKESINMERPPVYTDTPIPNKARTKSVSPQRNMNGSSKVQSPSSEDEASRPSSKSNSTVGEEAFEDFLSGGSEPTTTKRPSVNLMGNDDWNGSTGAKTTNPALRNSFLSSMDPLKQQANETKGVKQQNTPQRIPVSFEDDNGQTVGPVTLAEMAKQNKNTSDGSNVYNASLVDKTTKSVEVARAMEMREQQVREDVEKARNELRQREEQVRQMAAMKEQAGAVLGPKLKAWAEDNGRVKNIRTLLSTMHLVMWEGSKWTEVNMGKLLQPSDVKKQYRKAMIVVHPDKSAGRNPEQLLIAERVFTAVNTAWEEFAKTNAC